MKKTVKVDVTLMNCSVLLDGRHQVYLEYLKKISAMIESSDSEEKLDPLLAAIEDDQASAHFTVWIDNIPMSVSLLRSGVYIATVEVAKVKKLGSTNPLTYLIKMADELFLILGAKYGYADVQGDPPPSLFEAISTQSVRWLFWINYFGRDFINHHDGIEYYVNAPFVKVSTLDNGGIKCMTRTLPFEHMDSKSVRALIKYFGGSEQCEIYDAEKFPIEF
jgi:hypothetical protein